MCVKLTTLFIGNNKIKSWDELDKLRELPEFENTMLVGNPFYELLKDDAKFYALKKIPNLKIIDGIIVQATFQKKSNEFPDVFPDVFSDGVFLFFSRKECSKNDWNVVSSVNVPFSLKTTLKFALLANVLRE